MYETLTRYSDVLLQELQACKSMVPHLHKLDVLLWALQAAETLDAAEAEAANQAAYANPGQHASEPWC